MEMNSANVEAVVKQVLERKFQKQLRHRKQQEMKFQRQLT